MDNFLLFGRHTLQVALPEKSAKGFVLLQLEHRFISSGIAGFGGSGSAR